MILRTSNKITCNEAFEGKSIEQELREFMETGESPSDLRKIHDPIPTDRKDGVIAEYNIRTDRWEVAQDAMDKVNESRKARGEKRSQEKKAQQAAKSEDNARGTDKGGGNVGEAES